MSRRLLRAAGMAVAALALSAVPSPGGEDPVLYRPSSVAVGATVEGTTATVVASFRLEYPSEKWARVLLFERAPSPSGSKLPEGVTLLREGGRLYCLGRGPVKRKARSGAAPDTVEFRIEAKKVGRSLELAIPVPASAAKSVEIAAPGKWKAETVPEVPVETDYREKEKSSLVHLFPGGLSEVKVTLSPERLEPEPLMLAMRQRLSVELEPGFARTSAQLEGAVESGRLGGLEIGLPSSVEILRIRGPQVKSWASERRGASQLAAVEFLEPVRGKLDLSVLVEGKAAAGEPISVPAFTVRPAGGEALRTQGMITVVADESLKVEPARISGLVRLRSSAGRMSFRFDEPAYALGLRLERRVPKVVARSELGATVYEDAVRLEGALRFTTDEPGLLGLSASVGPGMRVLKVTGDKVSSWAARGGRLSVSFRGLDAGAHALRLEAVQRVTDPSAVRLRSISVDAARNEPGALGFSVGGKLRVVRASGRGFRQVEPRSLPPWLRAHSHGYVAEAGSELAAELAELVPKVESVLVATVRVRAERLRLDVTESIGVKRAPVFGHRYLIADDVDVLSAEGTLVSDFTQTGPGLALELSKGLSGQGDVSIRAHRYRERAEGTEAVPLPMRLGAEHAESYLVLVPDKGLVVDVALPGDGSVAEASAGELPKWASRPAGQVRIYRYRPKAEPAALEVAVRRERPEFSVRSVTLVDFEPSRYRARAELDYSITKGGLDELLVELPGGAADPVFDCPNLKRTEASGGGRWRLLLHGRASGALKLAASFQGPVPVHPKAVEFGGVVPVGASVHKGLVGFRGAKDLEVVEDLDRYAGLERELSWPANYARHSDYRTVYSFDSAGWQLAASVERHGRAAVAQAVVTECRIVSAVERDGSAVTEMICKVQNSGGKQFLGVTHPEGAMLWGAYVDGKPVKTSEAPAPGGGTHALVPVLSTKEVAEAKLVYESHVGSSFAGMSVNLATPKLDVEAEELTWEVRLPEGVRALPAGGNMVLAQAPEGAAHASLVSLLVDALEGFIDMMGPLAGGAAAVLWFLLRLAVVAGLIGIGLWLFVKVLVLLAERRRAIRLAPVVAVVAMVVLVGLIFVAGTARMGARPKMLSRRAPAAGEWAVAEGGAAEYDDEDTFGRPRTLWDNVRRPGLIERAAGALGLSGSEDSAAPAETTITGALEAPEAEEEAGDEHGGFGYADACKFVAPGKKAPATPPPAPVAAPKPRPRRAAGRYDILEERRLGAELPQREKDKVFRDDMAIYAGKPAERPPADGPAVALEDAETSGDAYDPLLKSKRKTPEPAKLQQSARQITRERLETERRRKSEEQKKRSETRDLLEFARKQAAKGKMGEALSQYKEVLREGEGTEFARQAQQAIDALEEVVDEKNEELTRTRVELDRRHKQIDEMHKIIQNQQRALTVTKEGGKDRDLKAQSIKDLSSRLSRKEAELRAMREKMGWADDLKPEGELEKPTSEVIEKLFINGVDSFESGDYDRAKESFEEVLRLDPGAKEAERLVKEAGTRKMVRLMTEPKVGRGPHRVWQLYRRSLRAKEREPEDARDLSKVRSTFELLQEERKVKVQELLVELQKGYEDGRSSYESARRSGVSGGARAIERSERDLDKAISSLERSREVIRWMPYDIDLSNQKKQVDGLLAEAKALKAARSRQLSALKKGDTAEAKRLEGAAAAGEPYSKRIVSPESWESILAPYEKGAIAGGKKGQVELKIYDIRDLVEARTGFPGPELDLGGGRPSTSPAKSPKRPTASDIAELIQSQIRPDSWAAELGGSIEDREGRLVVMQDGKTHAMIEGILDRLRAGEGTIGMLAAATPGGLAAARPKRAEQNYFSTASGGLAKGALPLPVSIAGIEGATYVFKKTRLGSATGELRIRCVTRGAVGLLDVVLVAAAAVVLYLVGRRSATAGAALSLLVTGLSILALNVAGSDVAASAGPLAAVGVVGLLVFVFRRRFPSGGAAQAGR